MQTSRALRIHSYGGPEVLQMDQVTAPRAGDGQVVVQVKAAGINGLDWKVREGYVRDAFPLALPSALGIEIAGVVVEAGPGTGRLKLGDRVMGPLMGVGGYADFVAVDEAKLSLTPEGLSDVAAAAVPVAALTAWQALRAASELEPGQSVLIHGAAGGVGGFAVQFAKAAGLKVLATASAASRAHVASLGADVVFDRVAERFEDQARGIDLVLDLVGGRDPGPVLGRASGGRCDRQHGLARFPGPHPGRPAGPVVPDATRLGTARRDRSPRGPRRTIGRGF